MNVLDPNMVLGTHEDLCSRLRETLEIEERRARQNDMVPEPIASAGEDQSLDLDAGISRFNYILWTLCHGFLFQDSLGALLNYSSSYGIYSKISRFYFTRN